MMDFSDLTILITCYNAENFMVNLEKVLSRALKASAVAVIVNDGSTDHTLENLRKLAATYPGITIVDSSNLGSASARNLALREVKTKYGVFLDADDSLNLPNLSELFRTYKNSGATHAIGNFVSLPMKTLGGMPTGKSNTVIKSSDHRDELFRNMGYWRYIYDVTSLRESGLSFEPTFEEVGSKFFILDDAYFLMKLIATNFELYVGSSTKPIYNYIVGDIDTVRWKRYLGQVRLIPLASRILLQKEKTKSRVDRDWFRSSILDFTFEQTYRLPLSLFLRSIGDLTRLRFEGHYKKDMFAQRMANNLMRSSKNSISGTCLYKSIKKLNLGN